MIKKIIGIIFLFLLLLFLVEIIYNNLPGEPVEMKTEKITDEESSILINYAAVPMFVEKLRFNHNNISFSIEKNCPNTRRKYMIQAFDIFSQKMELISFYEVNSGADIKVSCSNDYINLGENMFAAGEGGPSRIINTSGFKLIEEGKILLYDEPICNYPIVELHELGHVFGFDHSTYPKNIMYNVSNCDQRISPDMIDMIKNLYSIEALADILIENITAIRKGRYLDFNITILNEGLINADIINLSIIANDKIIDNIEIGKIDVGFGRTLRITNLKLPSRNIHIIKFVVDINNKIKELKENNNIVIMEGE